MKLFLKLVLLPLISSCCVESDNKANAIGIDVSHYQGHVNWPLIKKSGYSFAYIKVSEGETISDPKFKDNWMGASKEALLHGGYHVFTAGDLGKKQAKNFLENLKRVQYDYHGYLPPVLDIEAIPKSKLIYAQPEIIHWLKVVEKAIGCKPIIYTSPATWDFEFLGDFSQYSLWLADYSNKPTLPNYWKKWAFWQFNSSGNIAGIEGSVDVNHFNGDTDKLNSFACIKW